jgi:Uma2 family endonuclease
MSAQLEKWHFNVDQYYRLAEVGVLKPDDRVELIEGEIIRMSPIGSPHAACVTRLTQLLHQHVSGRVIISVQNPVRLSEYSEPVPDVALLKPRRDFYAAHHPAPEDVLLVVEVSDTRLLADRNIKMPLYARSGIAEAWLVNLPRKLVEVYFDSTDGSYRESFKFKQGEVLVSPTVLGLSLAVDEIIG